MTRKCDRCGRVFDCSDEGQGNDNLLGGVFIEGDPAWEDNCSHCQFCMFDDCHVYLNRPKWWCKDCSQT